jgi:CubicO group peptidase (beta-lactamase class C family)
MLWRTTPINRPSAVALRSGEAEREFRLPAGEASASLVCRRISEGDCMPRWLAATFLLAALLAGPVAAEERSFATALSAFRNLHRAEIRRSGIAGSSFYVVRDGRIVVADHLGEQDVAAHVPIDARTIYHWASITKTMTGIAIMQLRDRGLLALDDPIVRYVPELEAVHNPFGDMKAITLRHLMSHSAGFGGATWRWRDRDWQPFEPRSWAQLAAMLPYTDVQFRPGTRFSYSNPGIVYLGQVIERLSGEDFEVYVDKNILKPLGMHASYFDRTPPHLLPYRSHSYYVREGERVAAPFDVDTGVTVSNGGLNAPLPDMAKYVAFLLGDPARNADYDLVLKRSSLEEMWQPQISAGHDFTQGRMAETTQSGLSFFIDQAGGIRFVGHNGDQNGFRTYLSLCPDQRAGSLLAFNTETRGVENNPTNRETAESRMALAAGNLCKALAKAQVGKRERTR